MDSTLENFFHENQTELLERLKKFLSFKTISSHSSAREELESCAEWLQKYLLKLGGHVELWREYGPPIVFAHFPALNKDAPTVLIYNHYDVQPVDPLTEWTNPPFEAKIEGDTIFARGAQDNKGQCFFVLMALEAMKGSFPCSIKLIIEGEEENGSAHLNKIAKAKAKELSADYTMIIDVGMRSSTTPAITLGTRGLTALTIKVEGPNQDLHSGLHGGITQNPLHALVNMLASLRRDDGSIAVQGFYDAVVMPSFSEREILSLSLNEEAYKKEFGQRPTGGEKKFTPTERNWLRPTLEINGIHGGYGGEGTKTVIPREAFAKISCRLVPFQDPEHIAQLVKSHLESVTPEGIVTSIEIHEGKGKATRTKTSSKAIIALSQAMRRAWNMKEEYILDGASIPISPLLEEVSGGELVMWGVGLPSDRIHSPNENFSIDRLKKGCLTLFLTLEALAKASKNLGV